MEQMEKIQAELRQSIQACSDRGLYCASKWAAEQLVGISKSRNQHRSTIPFVPLSSSFVEDWDPFKEERDLHLLAKTYFDLKEYKRCAWVLKDCNAFPNLFLWGYATYLAGEKQLHETLGPVLSDSDTNQHTNELLPSILEKLQVYNQISPSSNSDPWLLYLKGLICVKTRNLKSAIELLMKSVKIYAVNWSAWVLLAQCMTSEVIFQTTKQLLPDSIMKCFFTVYTVLHQHFDTKEAWTAFSHLEVLFEQSSTVAGYRAQTFYEERNLRDSAIQFNAILKVDPYRIDGIDIFGNALFVLQEKAELCRLCQSAIEIDKHRPETYICIGNFYSCKNQHEAAAEYLRRAISLNRVNAMAWVLLGHEFLELNMTEASTEAYRRATDINPRDFQAWFGLGHIYNLLQLYPFAIEYSRRSLAIRPNDGRIWANLASIFKKMGRLQDAKFSAERSVTVDPYYLDPNMYALLGRLYDDDDETMEDDREASPDSTANTPLRWYQQAWEERDRGTIALHADALVDTCVYLTKHALAEHQMALVTAYMDALQLHAEASKSEKVKLLQAEIRDHLQARSAQPGEEVVTPSEPDVEVGARRRSLRRSK